jgi:hypothetical protein
MCFQESSTDDMPTLVTSEVDRVLEGALEMATLSLQPKLAMGFVLVEDYEKIIITLPPSLSQSESGATKALTVSQAMMRPQLSKYPAMYTASVVVCS